MAKKIRTRHYYLRYVIDAVRNHEHEMGNELSREDVQLMDPNEVLAIFLEWEGIIGYTWIIRDIMEDHEIHWEEYEDDSN